MKIGEACTDPLAPFSKDDLLAGSKNMESSYVMGRGKALEAFPLLKPGGLCGAVVYYDGERRHYAFKERD